MGPQQQPFALAIIKVERLCSRNLGCLQARGLYPSRLRTLAPAQYQIVEVRTKRGIARALLFPKAILQAEQDSDAPLREALAIKRETLRARRAERKKRSS